VSAPTAEDDAAANADGLTARRDLLQMRRPIPVDDEARAGIVAPPTRAFRPGQDEAAWVRVNNRAFAGHPDQADKTVADVIALEAEAWFDPVGFLVLEADGDGPRSGELDGFCWTKVHPHQPGSADPPLGEIYVIGVDPAAQGRHLGPALTVAGLDHLAATGITVGMLYVDVANAGAVRMYERLGFTTHHLDRIYSAP